MQCNAMQCNAMQNSHEQQKTLSISPHFIPIGQYCMFGTKPIDCPRYTYVSTTRSTSLNNCQSCPAGYWCNSTGEIRWYFYIRLLDDR